MTLEQLRRMHQTRPFVAFDIHLVDGRTLSVRHPEMLAVPPPGRTIGVGMEDGTIEIVDMLRVTSLKPHANGRQQGRTRKRS